MRNEYIYARLSEDWDFWIITMNIERELGKKPKGISSSTINVTIYIEDLTDEEKVKLDKLMSDVNVGLYPSSTEGYTIFKIKDIWDYRSIIERPIGHRVMWLHLPPALPDGTHILELWVEGELTSVQKLLVERAYGSLISGV